ncbi:hypothetical protein T459_14329 [Capsicum annuum]|uniref:Ubiquitin-like protease family profile domain-containing protein n=1 Tax=Capsicum annuum TaxID=4072 RepID=A0A2G2ZH97_CAPAN|nr:hypothetical protein T459_14329 [Capsicum annuum]
MEMVYDLLNHRFMYENKDKMDEVWINYCGIPVCFGWKEFSIVTGLKCYPASPSQAIPTLTQNKAPCTPKKGKGKLSDREDLVSIVGPIFKNKNLMEMLKGNGLSKKHKQSLCLIVHPSLVPTNRELKMSLFLTLRSVQTLPDPKVVDGIKMEFFGATAITRKIILEGGLVAIDYGSRSGSANGATVGANDSPLTVFETTSHYDYDQTGCTNFPHLTNVLHTNVKNRGIIPSKRISYPYTLLEIKAAKSKRKDTSKLSSSIEKIKIATPLSLTCTNVQCTRATGEKHEPKKVDVTAKSTAEAYNITVYNPSTASKEEEKVEPISSGERKNCPFERFNILDKAPKKLTQLINDYSKWIADGLLKHHADRYCQKQSKVSQNEECLNNIIKGFSIPAGLPWHLVDEMYILINCGDEFHWVWAVVDLKERRIRVYDSMSRTRHSGPSAEIQWLSKILSTYLDMIDFLDQKVRTDRSTIEAYWNKMGNPFNVMC